jgi:hypothetical protein
MKQSRQQFGHLELGELEVDNRVTCMVDFGTSAGADVLRVAFAELKLLKAGQTIS